MFTTNDSFTEGTNYRKCDFASFSQNSELREDVLIKLREKLETYICADTWRYLPFWMVFHLKVVLPQRILTLIFSGRGNTLNELNALDTFVIVMTR